MTLAPITGLFGTNSSGKSGILELLLLMKQTVESPDRTQVLDFGDERTAVALGGFRDVIFGHSSGENLSWSIGWDKSTPLNIEDPARPGRILFSGDTFHLQTTLRYRSRRVQVSQMSYEFDDAHFYMSPAPNHPDAYVLGASPARSFRFKRARGRAWPLPPPTKFYGFPDQVKAYYQNAAFLSDLQLAFEEAVRSIHYLGPLRGKPERLYVWSGAQPEDVGHRGERTIEALLAARARKQLISRGKGLPRLTLQQYVALWLRKLGLISSFLLVSMKRGTGAGAYEVRVRTSRSSPQVHLTDVGFGVSQVLPVLVLCYYVPPGSTLILEQPELHLHPSVQGGLADVFIDAVKRRRIQIIFESHSEHLLERLQLRLAEEKFKPADTALYFCENDDGVSTLHRLKVDIFGNITNWPPGFFGDPFHESAIRLETEMTRRIAGKSKLRQ